MINNRREFLKNTALASIIPFVGTVPLQHPLMKYFKVIDIPNDSSRVWLYYGGITKFQIEKDDDFEIPLFYPTFDTEKYCVDTLLWHALDEKVDGVYYCENLNEFKFTSLKNVEKFAKTVTSILYRYKNLIGVVVYGNK